jgi:hypothetical protein
LVAAAAVLSVGSKIDARGPATGLASARGIELVDPSGDAVHGRVRDSAVDGHSCAARRPAEFHDEQRAIPVAGDDSRFSSTERRLTTKQFQFERAGFEVESPGAVSGAMAAGIDTTRLKDLAG